ncbi:MAG TPA: hypothetical protein ENN09_00570, partial [Planctomycetes bacterium]|nr:hypothetical protein [Planctomycetota bacterium]
MANHQTQARTTALECLRRWADFSEAFWYEPSGFLGAGCFGTGYDNWGVQTNQKYLAAMATLAADGHERARDRFRKALRFSLSTHVTGAHRCTDGRQWGRTWISALGIERMMHGVEAMEGQLSDDEQRLLRTVITDEADHQLTAPVLAGQWAKDGRNKPESNIWNGAVCTRAALMYPDHPHRAAWMERAHLFLINGISLPADAEDNSIAAGKPVRERHVGANFFPHFALDHHGYLNTGYMVICLSNIAMLHYSCRMCRQKPPETLYHNARGLWNLVRLLVADDGRLLRIGGDTRIRYCYCQDYLIPTLIFAADFWGDARAAALVPKAVELAKHEQECGSDGGFLSARLGEIRRANPYYYTRLESDRAVSLSMAAAWLNRFELPPPDETPLEGAWLEQEHGAVLHRSTKRFVSWSWRAAETPQGLCLPTSNSSLAEWMENLAGSVQPSGRGGCRRLKTCSIRAFDGGFITSGEIIDGADVVLDEGWKAAETARHILVFSALPDGRTAVRLERAELPPRRVYVAGWAGVKLEIPNDLFNGGKRRYAGTNGVIELASHEGARRLVGLDSKWVCVDGAIGLVLVYGAEGWSILQRGVRMGGHAYGSILTDALCCGISDEPQDFAGPAALIDNAC